MKFILCWAMHDSSTKRSGFLCALSPPYKTTQAFGLSPTAATAAGAVNTAPTMSEDDKKCVPPPPSLYGFFFSLFPGLTPSWCFSFLPSLFCPKVRRVAQVSQEGRLVLQGQPGGGARGCSGGPAQPLVQVRAPFLRRVPSLGRPRCSGLSPTAG